MQQVQALQQQQQLQALQQQQQLQAQRQATGLDAKQEIEQLHKRRLMEIQHNKDNVKLHQKMQQRASVLQAHQKQKQAQVQARVLQLTQAEGQISLSPPIATRSPSAAQAVQQQLTQEQLQRELFEQSRPPGSKLEGGQSHKPKETSHPTLPPDELARRASRVKVPLIEGIHPDLNYNRASEDVTSHLTSAPIEDDEKCTLLTPRRGTWVYAVKSPLTELQRLCETKPVNKPVGWVSSMRHMCGRWGIATATRAGCVELCVHNPISPGRPQTFWLPREAVGMIADSVYDDKGTKGHRHRVRVLDDTRIVEMLCESKPDESPVTFVRAIASVVGKEGELLESRGDILKLRFAPAVSGKKDDIELWLPKEAVVICTPWK